MINLSEFMFCQFLTFTDTERIQYLSIKMCEFKKKNGSTVITSSRRKLLHLELVYFLEWSFTSFNSTLTPFRFRSQFSKMPATTYGEMYILHV